MRDYLGSGLLAGRRSLVTGGDSGIGRAVSVAFAKEGADVAIAYLNEEEDAARTAKLIEAEGRRCVLIPGDLASEAHCRETVSRAAGALGGLDVLVLHHGTQQPAADVRHITSSQLERTFQVNVLSLFWLVQAAVEHLGEGSSIVVTGSINGLRGNKHRAVPGAGRRGDPSRLTRTKAGLPEPGSMRPAAALPPASVGPGRLSRRGRSWHRVPYRLRQPPVRRT
jgi:NAD(P)-dependent dehydrogenase (short-subunit alcohol dehydrogenase family)